MNTIILSSGKEINLSEPNCLPDLKPSEFEELISIIHAVSVCAEAA